MTHVLLISGSLRTGSSNAAVLETVAAVAADPISTFRYEGLADLPHFNPDLDQPPLPAAVSDLRAQIESADALLFCTPEYAGALPGSLKNLLDWTVGGIETSDKPTGWINISPLGRGAAGAHAELATVLRYTDARLVDAACVHIPVDRSEIDATGLVRNPQIRQAVADVLTELAHA